MSTGRADYAVKIPRFRTALLSGVVIGTFVPVAGLLACSLRLFTMEDEWLLFIWPTSIMLMFTENVPAGSAEDRSIIAAMVVWNVVIYTVVFVLLWCVAWTLAAVTRKPA